MLRRRGAASRSGDDLVIVTGASGGIGLEVSKRFAARGAKVGMIARDHSALETAAAAVDGTVSWAVADVADREALAVALSHIEDRLGQPTMLINNAGHGHWGSVVETEPDEFRRAIDVNYLGAVNAIGIVLPGMLARASGSIVNVASIAGRIGAPFEAAYSASKFALVGFTESLSIEIAGTGVTVSLVHPGPTDTDFFGRRGQPYELRRPRPIPAARVADTIVRAATHPRPERFVPAWLGVAWTVRAIVPPLSRAGTKRMFAEQRRALRRRLDR